MVLTEEERKERKRIIDKRWRDNNKEKEKQRNKIWRDTHTDYEVKRRKEYYEKNKHNNTEKRRDYNKLFRQTPNGKRTERISSWKSMGVVSKDYNLLYDNYLKSTNCEECGIEYSKKGDGIGTFKCLDHCHETGLFRNYLCHGCNARRG